jgi:hypothetical protein
MTSWVVWVVTAVVAFVIGFTATHFNVRTLRYVTAGITGVLIVAVTAYGQTPSDGQAQPNLETAFAFGADRLAGAWFHPLWTLWSASATPAPGRLGWSAIAVVLLIGYRQAEQWAVRRQAPQLDTSRLDDVQPSVVAADGSAYGSGNPDGLTPGQRHEWLAAEVKFRLAAIDVFAPPILPGGTRSGALASIAESTGVAGASLAAAIIRLLGPLWPSPRRYELRVWVEGGEPEDRHARRGASGRWATQHGASGVMAHALTAVRRIETELADQPTQPTLVTVELDEPGTGVTVASKTIVAKTLDDSASMVAGYVARQIFARDPASPSWCYGAADGRDLGALGLARQDRVYVENADDMKASRSRQIEILGAVTGADRCAGIVRYELAQLLDLQQEHLAALRLHAMNREQYPRFFRGTYRLCMSLQMIANPEFTVSDREQATAILNETLAVLCRVRAISGKKREYEADDLRLAHDAGTANPKAGKFQLSPELRETLLEAARHELRTIKRQLSLPVVLWNTFWRRSERAVWKLHLHPATRQEFRDGICVAELLVAVKHQGNQRDLANEANKRALLKAAAEPKTTTEPETTTKPGAPVLGLGRLERFRLHKGLQVAAAITGETAMIRTVLREGFPENSGSESDPGSCKTSHAERVPPKRDRVRWLPWRKETASWQAAYNTACLHAVLLQRGLSCEEHVITSLLRMVNNRDSGLERPYDWISNDPDFEPLLTNKPRYKEVNKFLEALELRDYPPKHTSGGQPANGHRAAPQSQS